MPVCAVVLPVRQPPDVSGDLESMDYLAGQSVGLVKEIKPAAEVITNCHRQSRPGRVKRLSDGRRGLQIELEPNDARKALDAIVRSLSAWEAALLAAMR